MVFMKAVYKAEGRIKIGDISITSTWLHYLLVAAESVE